MKNKKYTIEVEFTFKGKVEVFAENKQKAKEIIQNDLFMTSQTGIHTSNSTEDIQQEGVSDWEFPCHADKKIK